MRQVAFSFLQDYKKEFGGSLLIGKRKDKRPLSTKHPIHLILKSCHKRVFNPSNMSLEKLIRDQAKKFNIKIYDMAVNWSHIHLVIQLKDKNDYTRFIRSLTSIMASKIRKVFPCLKEIFTLRPYTRIISWGRQFKNALQYQVINKMESFGLIKRDKTQNHFTKLNARKRLIPPSGKTVTLISLISRGAGKFKT